VAISYCCLYCYFGIGVVFFCDSCVGAEEALDFSVRLVAGQADIDLVAHVYFYDGPAKHVDAEPCLGGDAY